MEKMTQSVYPRNREKRCAHEVCTHLTG